MLLVLRISRPGKRRGNCVFQEKHISEKEKTSGKESSEQGFELEVGGFGSGGADGANGASAFARGGSQRNLCHRASHAKKVKDIHVSVVQS